MNHNSSFQTARFVLNNKQYKLVEHCFNQSHSTFLAIRAGPVLQPITIDLSINQSRTSVSSTNHIRPFYQSEQDQCFINQSHSTFLSIRAGPVFQPITIVLSINTFLSIRAGPVFWPITIDLSINQSRTSVSSTNHN